MGEFPVQQKPMTVQQLITRLNKIKDKSILVSCENSGLCLVKVEIGKVDLSPEKRAWLITESSYGR